MLGFLSDLHPILCSIGDSPSILTADRTPVEDKKTKVINRLRTDLDQFIN